MNPRTTGILFLLLAGLGAFVWFYEIEGEAGRKDAEAAAKRIFPGVESSAVDQIELTSSDGQRVRLERRDADWDLVLPVKAAADGFAADSIASALAQLASEAVFESPQPLAVYGLEDESRDLVFRAGESAHELRLGKPTPTGGNRYAFIEGRTSVFTVAAHAVNALSKSLDDLREKRVLRFDGGSAQRVTVRWTEGQVVLARVEAGWKLEEPITGPADEKTVDELLSDLSFLRATGFVDAPTPEQLATLATPELEVELAMQPEAEGQEARRLTLAIGAREGDEGDRLARAEGAALYRIPSERLQDFARDVASYRFRELARFEPDEAERLEIVFTPQGGEAVTVTAERGKEGWSSTPETVEPERLANMIDELSRLRANRILADEAGDAELRELGLVPPAALFTVSGEKADPLARVEIGIVRGSDGVIARSAGSPMLYLLAPAVADTLPVNLGSLRNRFLAKPEPAEGAAGDEAAPAPGGFELEP